MSHFTRIATQMVEKEYLTRALTALGYAWEEGDVRVRGFAGASEHAQIKLRLSNGRELGFRKAATGYDIVADWWGTGLDPAKFQQSLVQQYAYQVARDKLEAQGFSLVNEEKQEDGRLHLVLRRAA